MRISECFSFAIVFASLLVATPVAAQKPLAQSPRILSAKSVHFKNQTGFDAVGKNAVAQLGTTSSKTRKISIPTS